MKVLIILLLLSITIVASSGLKKEPVSWLELRAQQQADSAVYEAVLILDSIYQAKHIK